MGFPELNPIEYNLEGLVVRLEYRPENVGEHLGHVQFNRDPRMKTDVQYVGPSLAYQNSG